MQFVQEPGQCPFGHCSLLQTKNRFIMKTFTSVTCMLLFTLSTLYCSARKPDSDDPALLSKGQAWIRAHYPLAAGSLNHTAEWTANAPGILPSITGQLAINAGLGFSMAGLGDVNGDGFDDVAIGAPAMVNAVSG